MSDDATKDDSLYCFLDTCTLLHFTTFDEVDWPAVLGVPSVCLMVAPIVVRELNDHKDDSHNDRRQQRARVVIRKLRTFLLLQQQFMSEPVGGDSERVGRGLGGGDASATSAGWRVAERGCAPPSDRGVGALRGR
jgi:hypothetical protein